MNSRQAVAIANMETRDPDKRIAELEAAVNELNSFDAPAELVSTLAQLSELRKALQAIRDVPFDPTGDQYMRAAAIAAEALKEPDHIGESNEMVTGEEKP